MAARLSPFYDRESSARSYEAAQQHRSEREPVPCFLCGSASDCKHRKVG